MVMNQLICLDHNYIIMKSISLSYLAKGGDLKSNYIYLKGSTGIRYRCLALYVPSYGWVPCSRKN